MAGRQAGRGEGQLPPTLRLPDGRILSWEGAAYFGASSDELTDEARAVLDQSASGARSGTIQLVLAGHADAAEGTSAFTVGLSQRRANRARDYLVARGGHHYPGFRRITSPCRIPRPEAANRRVEVSTGPGSGW